MGWPAPTNRYAVAGALACVVAFLVLGLSVAPLRAQGPSIAEYRRLIGERVRDIERLEARNAVLEARGDSLALVKRRADPGGTQFMTVSNAILEASQQITGIQRQLRTLYGQVRDLKTRLYVAYNDAIAQTSQQIERLPKTAPNTRELRRLTDQLGEYVLAREVLVGEIEEAQVDLYLPELVFDPSDGPTQLEHKEAFARDAMDKIDLQIAAIQGQIAKAVQRKRTAEELRRLRDDIELWGDAQARASGDQIEAILEGRAAGPTRPSVFDDPDARIRELQRRRLELLEKRQEYERKARQFAERLRAFYR
ncbi:MAG: hypothetical protein ABR559_00220 [Gemmatimonadota bacterium]